MFWLKNKTNNFYLRTLLLGPTECNSLSSLLILSKLIIYMFRKLQYIPTDKPKFVPRKAYIQVFYP